MSTDSALKIRKVYLAVGVFSMLFSGVLYAWSILKIPFKEEFGWSDSSLALNFTLTMCFFCLGAFFGSLICKRIGPKITLIIAGVLVGAGFIITSLLTPESLPLLYIAYAFLAGTGIGISYNVIVSTVNAWFPDRKGFCSGCLMLGFGVSTLLLGNAISIMFENPNIGWSKAYLIIGIIIAVVLILSGIILKRPDENKMNFSFSRQKYCEQNKPLRKIYLYAVSRTIVEKIIERLDFNVEIIRNVDDADIVLAHKNFAKGGTKILATANEYHLPVFFQASENDPAQKDLRPAQVP